MSANKERRRNRRYRCIAPATVQVSLDDVPCLARIVDLSIGGCLVVLRDPQSLSEDTVVELTFDVDQLPFRLRAQVRAIRSDVSIGCQFLIASPRVQKRLDDLIGDIVADLISDFEQHKSTEIVQ